MERKNLKIKKYLPIALIKIIGDKMLEVEDYVARVYIKNVMLLAFSTNFEVDNKKEEAAIDYITENYEKLEEDGYFIGFSSIDNFYMIDEYIDYETNVVKKISKVLDKTIPFVSEIEAKIKKLDSKEIIDLINSITKK